jgi:hypothetical protein
MNYLGLSIASGTIYYGVLALQSGDTPPHMPTNAPASLAHRDGPADAVRLADTYERIKQDLRLLAPCEVVIVGTRLHGNWAYKAAFERISLITMIMLACVELGTECEEWSTEKIGKLVGLPPQSLASFDCREVGFTEKPKYWSAGRAAAFAAAKAKTLVKSN